MLRCRLLLPLLALHGCGLPRDPDKTSERIAATHELRVGVTENAPWVALRDGQPSGIEPALVRKFAAQNGARVTWTKGSETSLAQALKRHQLDLAIGGFDAKTPWVAVAGVSQPFARTADRKQHVFLAVPGENHFILALDAFLSAELQRSNGDRS